MFLSLGGGGKGERPKTFSSLSLSSTILVFFGHDSFRRNERRGEGANLYSRYNSRRRRERGKWARNNFFWSESHRVSDVPRGCMAVCPDPVWCGDVGMEMERESSSSSSLLLPRERESSGNSGRLTTTNNNSTRTANFLSYFSLSSHSLSFPIPDRGEQASNERERLGYSA